MMGLRRLRARRTACAGKITVLRPYLLLLIKIFCVETDGRAANGPGRLDAIEMLAVIFGFD